MLLLPLGIGGFAILSLAVAKRAAARRPLPADVAGTIRAALRGKTSEQLNAAVAAIAGKYSSQAKLIRTAVNLEGDPHLTPDVRAAYIASLHTGQPELLEQASRSFESKYHYLAAHLRDVADVLSSLRGVA